jgi:hypothetical protein
MTVREAGADYLFAVKRNQPGLQEDVQLLFRDPPPGERFLTAWTVDVDRRRARGPRGGAAGPARRGHRTRIVEAWTGAFERLASARCSHGLHVSAPRAAWSGAGATDWFLWLPLAEAGHLGASGPCGRYPRSAQLTCRHPCGTFLGSPSLSMCLVDKTWEVVCGGTPSRQTEAACGRVVPALL